MIYSFYFKVPLFVTLVICSIIVLQSSFDKPFFKSKPLTGGLLLAGMLLLTFLIRLLYLRNIENDVDTSTWLSAVISFNHYDSKIWTLLNYSDSRPLTVLPLIAGHWLGLPVGYASAETIGLLFWIGSMFLLYKTFNIFLPKTMTLVVIWSLCLFISTIWYGFAAYNSEHVSIFMIALSVAAYISFVYGKWKNGLVSISVGILLGSFVYAKFQNAPMGVLIGLFLFIEMGMRKQWKNGILLIFGSILPTLLINIYFASIEKLDVFWNNYFWNYFYYSFTNQFSGMPLSSRFSVLRCIRFVLYSANSGIYILTLGVVIVAGFLLNYKSFLKKSGAEIRVFTFSFFLLFLSVYAVLQSGNNFQHYKLYIIIPLLLFAVLILSQNQLPIRRYLLVFLTAGSLLQTAINIYTLKDLNGVDETAVLDDELINTIRQYTITSDPIVVWGWRDAIFVRANRPMGYRDAHVFHFSLQSPLIPYWTRDFISDMEINKPKLFIEAMIPVYSERGHMLRSHDEVPAIYNYVRKHYKLVKEFNGIKIFRRIG